MNFVQPIPTTMSAENLLLALHGCLENSDDGFLVVDTDGKIAYINDAYCRYINIDRASVLGRPVLESIDTSQMVQAATDPSFKAEVGSLHKVSEKQYRDGEHYSIVNRANVSLNGVSVAGVGQIKFVQNALKLSARINDVYDELAYYKQELQRVSDKKYSFHQVLGDSAPMKTAKDLARRAAENAFPVLITGETGTGKEVFANAIHYASKRKSKPFIRINCAAIPAELFESELFGYEEGSFTGARRGGKKGKFELANGGTLFLDEIGDMPLMLQAKILRVLQEGELQRVGGEKTIPVDVRIIAATNKDLEQEILNKSFRADLYFRINVLSIALPPLRQHPEDIDLYIDTFLKRLNEKHHSQVMLTPAARAQFHQYAWPGNIRELKNEVERSYALQEGGMIVAITAAGGSSRIAKAAQSYAGEQLETIMEKFERQVLLESIARNQGNLRQTAVELGIHRVTLYKKMEKYGITREECGIK